MKADVNTTCQQLCVPKFLRILGTLRLGWKDGIVRKNILFNGRLSLIII